jgi:selenide,water dikinase
MGGRPLTALAIAAFPKEGLDREVIQQIVRGGFDMLRAAGVALLGGHTVQDSEIKFGYAVTGAIEPGRVLANAGVRPGDVLFLTKALGTGVIATALKFQRITPEAAAAAIRSMRTLNRAASDAMHAVEGVHACTDVTGFGLIGHATGMARASNVTLVFDAAKLPVLDGAYQLVGRNKTGGGQTNREHFSRDIQVAAGVDPALIELCYDPQTSGGLLVSVDPSQAEALTAAFARNDVAAVRVGLAETADRHTVRVVLN